MANLGIGPIINDFKGFFDLANLVLAPDPSVPGSSVVFNQRYKIHLFHDFSSNGTVYFVNSDWLSEVPAMQERYRRRIARFYRALAQNRSVYFIRRTWGSASEAVEQIAKIVKVVETKFPKLNFKLLCICPNQILPNTHYDSRCIFFTNMATVHEDVLNFFKKLKGF